MAGDPELLLRRFEREARATAALKSPHTVQLYDFGVTEDGRLYYVMELLDGLDLDTLVRQYGPLPAERVVHLLRQVCSSLADAHANGLVHRDIKPANVVVSRAGTTFDFVKVLDFGLVKLDSARDADKELIKLSAEDGWSGTPGSWRRRWCSARPTRITGSTCTRWAVSRTGFLPVLWSSRGRPPCRSWSSTSGRSRTGRHSVPSCRSRLALEDLVMECLEKDPARRPASAEVVSERVAAVPLTTAWTAEQAEQWWAAHRPRARDARPAADVLLSHEGHELRIGARVRTRG